MYSTRFTDYARKCTGKENGKKCDRGGIKKRDELKTVKETAQALPSRRDRESQPREERSSGKQSSNVRVARKFDRAFLYASTRRN